MRTARASDAGDIARLTTQLGYDVEPGVLHARLARLLAHPGQEFLVAERERRVVGWVHVVSAEFLDTDPFAVIAGLVVESSERRRGIGRLLMARAEEWATEHGCLFVRLWSTATRTEAHRFYERLGYTNIKTQYSFAKALDPTGHDRLAQFVPRVGAQDPEST